jgi:hypothetical protein
MQNDPLKLLRSPGLSSFFSPDAPQIKMPDTNVKDLEGESLSAEVGQDNLVDNASQAQPKDSI